MRHRSSLSLALAGFGSLAVNLGVALPALASTDLSTALSSGTPHLQLRIRGELVEQDNPLEDAAAATARARLGYTTQVWKSWKGLLEFEATEPFGGEAYNSLRNGNSGRSVVADPDGDEVNQAWLEYEGLPNTRLRLGRTRLVLDNARYIGNVGWRQNEQTYDGYLLTNASLPDTRIVLAQLNNANAPLFNNRAMDTQLLNLRYSGWSMAQVTGYHYRINFDQSANDHKTTGVRVEGAAHLAGITWPWSLEHAVQIEHGEANDFELDYWQFSAGIKTQPVLIAIGYEQLGSNGTQGFATPLATLHGHNGWADIFVNTPNEGLQDLSLKVAGKGLGFNWAVIGHDFTAARGGQSFGQELDVSLKRSFDGGLTGLLKFAVFEAASGSNYVDTRKAWVQLEYEF